MALLMELEVLSRFDPTKMPRLTALQAAKGGQAPQPSAVGAESL